MSGKHTPTSLSKRDLVIERYLAASAYLNNQTPESWARLKAYAAPELPDLLAACDAIAALSDGQGRANMLEVANMARAAIAKARQQ
ncbi:hypothetical protein FJY70_00280 [candidate division WOR-3 bacterium]|nr:hypothetical protein [candidate division WOR-3 bacterium]